MDVATDRVADALCALPVDHRFHEEEDPPRTADRRSLRGECGARADGLRRCRSDRPRHWERRLGNAGDHPLPGSPTLDVTTLTSIARNGVASEGGRDVTSADAVLTTRDEANAAASGAIIPADEAVFLIQVTGHFTAYGASLSQNAAGYPTGPYLTLIAEASNGRVVDWSVGSKAADLASLGTVIALPL